MKFRRNVLLWLSVLWSCPEESSSAAWTLSPAFSQTRLSSSSSSSKVQSPVAAATMGTQLHMRPTNYTTEDENAVQKSSGDGNFMSADDQQKVQDGAVDSESFSSVMEGLLEEFDQLKEDAATTTPSPPPKVDGYARALETSKNKLFDKKKKEDDDLEDVGMSYLKSIAAKKVTPTTTARSTTSLGTNKTDPYFKALETSKSKLFDKQKNNNADSAVKATNQKDISSSSSSSSTAGKGFAPAASTPTTSTKNKNIGAQAVSQASATQPETTKASKPVETSSTLPNTAKTEDSSPIKAKEPALVVPTSAQEKKESEPKTVVASTKPKSTPLSSTGDATSTKVVFSEEAKTAKVSSTVAAKDTTELFPPPTPSVTSSKAAVESKVVSKPPSVAAKVEKTALPTDTKKTPIATPVESEAVSKPQMEKKTPPTETKKTPIAKAVESEVTSKPQMEKTSPPTEIKKTPVAKAVESEVASKPQMEKTALPTETKKTPIAKAVESEVVSKPQMEKKTPSTEAKKTPIAKAVESEAVSKPQAGKVEKKTPPTNAKKTPIAKAVESEVFSKPQMEKTTPPSEIKKTPVAKAVVSKPEATRMEKKTPPTDTTKTPSVKAVESKVMSKPHSIAAQAAKAEKTSMPILNKTPETTKTPSVTVKAVESKVISKSQPVKATKDDTPPSIAKTTDTPTKTTAKASVATQVETSTPSTAKINDKGDKIKLPPMPKMETLKMDLDLFLIPKNKFPHIPKMQGLSKQDVEKAAKVAKEGSNAVLNALSFVAKETVAIAQEAKKSLNTTTIEDTDVTYEEALGKVATSAKGFFKLCGVVGELVKDSATFVATEYQNQQQKKKTGNPSKEVVDVKQSVGATTMTKRKTEPITMPPARVYGNPTISVTSKTETDIMDDVSFLEYTTKATRSSTAGKMEVSLEDIKAQAKAFWDNLVVSASSAVEEVSTMASKTAEKGDEELEDIKNKASNMFDSFVATASSALDDVVSKIPKDLDRMSLQDTFQRLQSKVSTSMDKKSRTSTPVTPADEKKSNLPFFLDPKDK